MNFVEKMAADIAETMNGGEWKDNKWYAEGHRQAWMRAIKPYADEIQRLRTVLDDYACCCADDEDMAKDCNEQVCGRAAWLALQQNGGK